MMPSLLRHRYVLGALSVAAVALGAGCNVQPADSGKDVSRSSASLTADQCTYFDVNGQDTICHHTDSPSHPFTILKTSDQGCINGHSTHPQDYIAVGDPTCGGGGCLPQGAPCDATLPCCDGSTCSNGTCVSLCACDDTFIPVCCAGVTYPNLCIASCQGATGCVAGACP
jgi:hypothetical protein